MPTWAFNKVKCVDYKMLLWIVMNILTFFAFLTKWIKYCQCSLGVAIPWLNWGFALQISYKSKSSEALGIQAWVQRSLSLSLSFVKRDLMVSEKWSGLKCSGFVSKQVVFNKTATIGMVLEHPPPPSSTPSPALKKCSAGSEKSNLKSMNPQQVFCF